MAEPRRIPKEEYDDFRSRIEERYGYENMSDEERAHFDSIIDQVAVVDDPSEETDPSGDGESVDDRSDLDKLKDELRSCYGYDDMSDDQRQAFDEKLDEAVGVETPEDEDPDPPEKVKVKVR